METGTDSHVEWTPKFILDTAADEDSFQSHGRIAAAIARVIQTNKDIKLIGLLGSWGSGKSTVVKLLCRELASKADAEDLVFTYDAWLQQNDPPRRAFLEGLLHFLAEKVKANKQDWKDKLDKLNRRLEENTTTTVPRLTWPGTLMVLSLLLIPLGARFTTVDWYKAAFGHDGASGFGSGVDVWKSIDWRSILLNDPGVQHLVPHARAIFYCGVGMCLFPLLLGTIFYGCWRPTWNLFSSDFWTWNNWLKHKAPHTEESILALYMNRETKTDYTRVLRDPEPSAIEFQDTFREIVEKTIKSDRRLIIVIDNLDRLPAEDALGMWATIRSFFLGSEGGLAERRTRYHPVVILPIAQDALARLYRSKDDDGAFLARSYMDKTFDLTFHLSRPVLTKWSEFLETQMVNVFGDDMPRKWSFVTARLYDRYSSRLDANPITPRAINTLINSIASTWLIWRGQVEFASVAYYCTYRDVIEKDIIAAVTDQVAPIKDFDPDWKASVAAIHFGVERDLASEVLLEQPIREAITDRSVPKLGLLTGVPGFSLILHRIVDDDAESPDAQRVLNTAWLLASVETAVTNQHFSETWRLLRSSLTSSGAFALFGQAEADASVALIKNCPEHDRSEFVGTCAKMISVLPNEITQAKGFVEALVSFWKAVEEMQNGSNLLPKTIAVPGSEIVFGSVADRLDNKPEILRRLNTRLDANTIMVYIVSLLTNTTDAERTEKRITAINATEMDIDWDGSCGDLTAIVRAPLANAAVLRTALFVLGEIFSRTGWGSAEIKAVATDGSLASRLQEAYVAKDDVIMARCLAFLVLAATPFPIPDIQMWPQMLAEREAFRHELDHSLNFYSGTKLGPLTQLVKLVKEAPTFRDLASVIAERWVTNRKLGRLVVDDVISSLPLYLNLLNTQELQVAFITSLENFGKFWEKMDAGSLEGSVADIYEVLVSAPTTAQRAFNHLKAKLDQESADTWENWLKQGGHGFDLAKTLHANDHSEWPALYDALDETIGLVLSKGDAGLVRRWFDGSDLVSESARVNAFKKLRDRIVAGTAVSNLAKLMERGGEKFIEDAQFRDKADDTVRYVVEPLLETAEGCEVLLALMEPLAVCLTECAPSTRDFVAERLGSVTALEHQAGADVRTSLSRTWKITLPQKADDDADSNKEDEGKGVRDE